MSISDADSALAVAALQAGAVDLVHKPTALATDRLYELGRELAAKVLAAGRRPGRHRARRRAAPPAPASAARPPRAADAAGRGRRPRRAARRRSPGSDGAARRFPAPVAVALHIPAGYTEALARRLDELAP